MRNRGHALSMVLAAGVLLGGSGTATADDDDELWGQASLDAAEAAPTAAPTTLRDLPNPPVIRSENGVLEATLTASPRRVTVAGRTFVSNVFNGQYIPPTLVVARGDEMRLTITNDIGAADVEIDGPEMTNVHYHGMDVTPKPPGDSVFIHIEPDKSFTNRFPIPPDHPQGLHWYHTHLHTLVEPQILSGLSGMLVVRGGLADHYPELVPLRRRVMVLKANLLPGQDPNSALTKTLNGFTNPPIRARPGEFQVWLIGNLGADAFFNLSLDGHRFWVLERDGNMLLRPVRQQTLFLPAGARTMVVVKAAGPGRYALRSLATDTGPQGDPNPEVVLGTMIVEGKPVPPSGLAERLSKPAKDINGITPRPDQIRNLPITNRRTITFSETADGNTFFINGKEYDENRIDTTVRLGAAEEWTLRNTSGELHVFHIHQLSFLVTAVQGQTPDYLGLRDVVDIPYQQNGQPGIVKIIIPFTNPVMVGKFVYHCHIVGHEDAGMMANIRVLPPARSAGGEAIEWLRQLAGGLIPGLWPAQASDVALVPPVITDADICRTGDGRPAGIEAVSALPITASR